MRAVDERVPGDVSAAAFWLVAGAIHPDAELTLRDVGVNPTRRAVIDLLRRDGRGHRGAPGGHGRDRGRIRPAPGHGDVGEPLADLVVRSSELRRRSTSARPTSPRRSTRSRSSASPRPWPAGPTHDPGRRRAAPQGIRPARRHRGRPARAGRADRGGRRRPADRRRRAACAAPRPTASTTTGWR